ncbi:MAG: ABC transporter ATP-binding protein [Paludibacter sp.]|jgi:ABC-2 type transport system ATP-binding protein
MNPVITCTNLTHHYGKRLIYENLNFSVPEGRILGLLGKNGTGKTTTINILNGYLKPSGGECTIFGENIRHINPITKQRIALLIEGHVQYSFMNIEQIERFYASFYPKWKKEAYYELMDLLKVAPRQRIANMSCGQRSQVALGLIMAQNADLLILDDFSLGLDPGYRRLFIEYLREYAKSERKTVFLTSHIIQDMEKLIDDCVILDYGKILIQKSVSELMDTFKKFTFKINDAQPSLPADNEFYNPAVYRGNGELFTFQNTEYVEQYLHKHGIGYSQLMSESLNLEDIFIGLTGKY